MKNRPLLWSALGGLAATAAAFLARDVLARSWKAALKEEPPRDPTRDDVGFGRAMLWAVASAGVAAGARMAARAATSRVEEGRNG